MTASPTFLFTDHSSKSLSDEEEEIDRENIMNAFEYSEAEL